MHMKTVQLYGSENTIMRCMQQLTLIAINMVQQSLKNWGVCTYDKQVMCHILSKDGTQAD